MERERKTVQLGLRIQPSLRKALEKWAIAEHRSLTSLVEKVMSDAATAAGYPPSGGRRSPKKPPRQGKSPAPKERAGAAAAAEQAAA